MKIQNVNNSNQQIGFGATRFKAKDLPLVEKIGTEGRLIVDDWFTSILENPNLTKKILGNDGDEFLVLTQAESSKVLTAWEKVVKLFTTETDRPLYKSAGGTDIEKAMERNRQMKNYDANYKKRHEETLEMINETEAVKLLNEYSDNAKTAQMPKIYKAVREQWVAPETLKELHNRSAEIFD